MLISNQYKFIFVHIYKNAGTSISAALMPFTGNVVQRFMHRGFAKLGIDVFNPSPHYGHIPASKLIEIMGRDKYETYFSFCFVRNPYAWQVSLYNFMLKNRDHYQHKLIKSMGNFTNYIQWRCSEEVRFQKDFIYSSDGELLVDFVGRYERLEEDFGEICKRIGISAKLPHLNVSYERPYQDYYTPETIELVKKTFQVDLDLFGYEYEPKNIQ